MITETMQTPTPETSTGKTATEFTLGAAVAPSVPATPDLAVYVGTYGPKPVTVECVSGDRAVRVNPADEASAVATITLHHMDSRVGVVATSRWAAATDAAAAAVSYDASLAAIEELVADLGISWTLPVPFTRDGLLTLVRAVPWLADLLFEASGHAQRFFGKSETS